MSKKDEDEYHIMAVNELLDLARELAHDNAAWAAAYLTSALLWLDVQLGDNKEEFLEMLAGEWEIVRRFLDSVDGNDGSTEIH